MTNENTECVDPRPAMAAEIVKMMERLELSPMNMCAYNVSTRTVTRIRSEPLKVSKDYMSAIHLTLRLMEEDVEHEKMWRVKQSDDVVEESKASPVRLIDIAIVCFILCVIGAAVYVVQNG